jgi:holin-like protein
MKYLLQFLLLMCFVFAGEFAYAVIPLPVPASIWGMIFLLIALMARIVKLEQIESVANWFLIIIPVLFVVPAVGIIDAFGEISEIWPQMLMVIGWTYLLSFAATGLIADWLIRRKNKRNSQCRNS